MSQSSRNDAVFGLILVFSAIVGVLIFKFSNAIGVDWETGLEIILKMAAILGVWAIYKYFSGYNPFTVWPLVLGGLCWAWFPAVDIWALQESSGSVFGDFQPYNREASIAWYGMWYAKGLVLALTVGGGYFVDSRL